MNSNYFCGYWQNKIAEIVGKFCDKFRMLMKLLVGLLKVASLLIAPICNLNVTSNSGKPKQAEPVNLSAQLSSPQIRQAAKSSFLLHLSNF